MFQKRKMQQIQYYTHEICFSHIDNDGEQYYQPKFYLNQKAFDLEPMESVILVLENCGANWFRQGMLQDMVHVNGRFEFAKTSAKQLCLYVQNYSSFAHIQVEQGTELSSLLNQSEIIYKNVGIPVDFFAVEKDPGWTTNNDDDEIPVDEQENPEVYYVKIFKKT